MTRLTGPMASFPLTLAQAARILAITPDAVVDLVRAQMLGAYLAAAHETGDRPPLRFHPDALPAVATELDNPDSRASGLYHVAEGLRAYLEQCPPTGRLGDAVDTGRPVLARTRAGVVLAHLQVDALIAFLSERLKDPPLRQQVTLRPTVLSALERLGCVRTRGIRPLEEAEQVWGIWWRVPASFWRLELPAEARLDDLPVFGGAREPDEPLVADRAGTFVPANGDAGDDRIVAEDPWSDLPTGLDWSRR